MKSFSENYPLNQEAEMKNNRFLLAVIVVFTAATWGGCATNNDVK